MLAPPSFHQQRRALSNSCLLNQRPYIKLRRFNTLLKWPRRRYIKNVQINFGKGLTMARFAVPYLTAWLASIFLIH
jgi:hypothetical protein